MQGEALGEAEWKVPGGSEAFWEEFVRVCVSDCRVSCLFDILPQKNFKFSPGGGNFSKLKNLKVPKDDHKHTEAESGCWTCDTSPPDSAYSIGD